LVNEGLLEIQGGRLNLTVGGVQRAAVSVASAATLAFTGGTHLFESGAAFTGTGQLRFQSPMQMAADLNFGSLNVLFEGSASVTGAFLITSGPAGSITVGSTMTFPGSMTIGGTLATTGTAVTVTINGTLTMSPGSTLNNPGTVRVNALVGTPGVDFTVVGNGPVNLGGTPFSIQSIRLDAGGGLARQSASTAGGTTEPGVNLRVQGPPGLRFEVQTSSDLAAWRAMTASIIEELPGVYDVRFAHPGTAHAFFRLRQASSSTGVDVSSPRAPILDRPVPGSDGRAVHLP
jgi:hypothetical protein